MFTYSHGTLNLNTFCYFLIFFPFSRCLHHVQNVLIRQRDYFNILVKTKNNKNNTEFLVHFDTT